jgi:hypothetical protein
MLFSGLKLLETRSHRDAAAAAFLAYFLIITNFLYTQSIPTAAAMCVALFALTATLVGFSAPQRAPRANLRTAGVLLAHAVPAALVLFLLFPRVHGPLWGLPQDAYAGMTGLSETMSPGTLSQLAQSDTLAFRAEFEGDPPPQAQRYWRGPVLWDFDGRTWRIGGRHLVAFSPPPGGLARYRYGVVLEPHNRHWLFALETAASLPASCSPPRQCAAACATSSPPSSHPNPERAKSGEPCSARSGCRRASIPARSRWPGSGARNRPPTRKSCRVPWRSCARGDTLIRLSRRCSGPTRWTSSCSPPKRDSASILLRPSRS